MVRASGRPLGLLYLVMVILRVSYGYGYTRGSGRVAIFGTGRVAEMLDPHTYMLYYNIFFILSRL